MIEVIRGSISPICEYNDVIERSGTLPKSAVLVCGFAIEAGNPLGRIIPDTPVFPQRAIALRFSIALI